jgi:glutathione S-transferase
LTVYGDKEVSVKIMARWESEGLNPYGVIPVANVDRFEIFGRPMREGHGSLTVYESITIVEYLAFQWI